MGKLESRKIEIMNREIVRRIERVERALIVTKRTRDPERTRDHPARDRRKLKI